MLEGIRHLDLLSVLGNKGNANDFSLLDAIEGLSFRDLSASWSCRGMLPSLSQSRTDKGADYRY